MILIHRKEHRVTEELLKNLYSFLYNQVHAERLEYNKIRRHLNKQGNSLGKTHIISSPGFSTQEKECKLQRNKLKVKNEDKKEVTKLKAKVKKLNS